MFSHLSEEAATARLLSPGQEEPGVVSAPVRPEPHDHLVAGAAHWGWGRVGGVAEGAQYQDRLAGLHQDGPAAVCVVGVSARVAGGGEGALSLSGDQVTTVGVTPHLV